MFLRIVDDIINEIINEKYYDNYRMPSEKELLIKYGTTRYEVRKAYERLVEMGYVYSIQGKGRYIKSKKSKIELSLYGNEGFNEKMTNAGYSCISKIISFEEILNVPSLKKRLEIDKINKIYKVIRLRFVNNEPVALHCSYISDKIFKNVEKEKMQIESLFDYYKQNGYKEYYYKDTYIQTYMPTNEERKVLNSNSMNLFMLLEGKCYDKKSNELLELSKIIYRGDKFIFKIDDK